MLYFDSLRAVRLFFAGLLLFSGVNTDLLVDEAMADDAATLESRIQKRSYNFKEAGKEVVYTLFVPSSYDADQPNKLLVLLHGLGSNPNQVIRYKGVVQQAQEHGYIVVAPYGYNERGWYGSRGYGNKFARRFWNRKQATTNEPENLGELSEKDVFNVMEIVRKEFNIDDDRIYLAGHSMGGGGTLHIALKTPEIWAGLAPMSPAIYSSPDKLENARHLPFIVVQGDKDRLVPVAIARNWVKKMDELGITHEYIEIPGGNHFSSIAKNPQMIAKVFAFFNSHTRQETKQPADTVAQ